MVIDTDIIIRYFTQDDPQKADAFENFLLSDQKAVITDVTIAEVYWTLRSFYKFSKERAIEGIEALVAYRSFSLNRIILTKAIKLLKITNISFIDAYTAAYSLAKNDGQVISFDRGFDHIEGITRVKL